MTTSTWQWVAIDAHTKYKILKSEFPHWQGGEQFADQWLLTGSRQSSGRLQIYGWERLCHHPAPRKQCPTGKFPITNPGGATKVEGGFLQHYFLEVKQSAKAIEESNLVSGKMYWTCFMIHDPIISILHFNGRIHAVMLLALCFSPPWEGHPKGGPRVLARQVTLIWRINQRRTSPSGPSPHHPWRRRQMSMKRWGNFQFVLGEVVHQTIF